MGGEGDEGGGWVGEGGDTHLGREGGVHIAGGSVEQLGGLGGGRLAVEEIPVGGVGDAGCVGCVGVVSGAQGGVHRHDDGTVLLAHGCHGIGVVSVGKVFHGVHVGGQHQRLAVPEAAAVGGSPRALVAAARPSTGIVRRPR